MHIEIFSKYFRLLKYNQCTIFLIELSNTTLPTPPLTSVNLVISWLPAIMNTSLRPRNSFLMFQLRSTRKDCFDWSAVHRPVNRRIIQVVVAFLLYLQVRVSSLFSSSRVLPPTIAMHAPRCVRNLSSAVEFQNSDRCSARGECSSRKYARNREGYVMSSRTYVKQRERLRVRVPWAV